MSQVLKRFTQQSTFPNGQPVSRGVLMAYEDEVDMWYVVEACQSGGHTAVTRAFFFGEMTYALELYNEVRDRIVNEAVANRLAADIERAR